MREPRRIAAADIEAWERRRREFFDQKRATFTERTAFTAWGQGFAREVVHVPTFREPKPIDEAEYATIRICECGKEWGQK
ncbi:hypothetical protein GS528_17060 [Rhodococcus hoagii]|nr:hypothetical protein [Prescottella equi]